MAWVYALTGDARAAAHARAGIAAGRDLASPIVECVCTGRLGLAQLCRTDAPAQEAADTLGEALRIAQDIEVPRFRAEALIGLCVAHGRLGQWTAVWRCGCEVLEILQHAGDGYLTALAELAIGIGAAHVGHPDADRWLTGAVEDAERCTDRYVATAARLWLAHRAIMAADTAAFTDHATEALLTMRQHGMDYLLTASPWVALAPSACAHLVHEAAALPAVREYARFLSRLASQPPSEHSRHAAGEQAPAELRIQTLGTFTVIRDGVAVSDSAWSRRKAKELLWLLCSRDSRSVRREEAIDLLWPQENLGPGSVRFRVALHALNEALEPDRRPRARTRFVHSRGDRIALDPVVHVDVDEFRNLAALAGSETRPAEAAELTRSALALYRGPFIEEAPYADWAAPLRDELARIFAGLVLRAARHDLDDGRPQQAVPLLRRLLDQDPYHEASYRLLAEAFVAAREPATAREVYQQCASRLWKELRVRPGWQLTDVLA